MISLISGYVQRYYESEREKVLAAVAEDPEILEDLHDVYKNDIGVVSAAVFKDPWVFDEAGDSIRGDREFVLSILYLEARAILGSASDELRGDEEIVFKAIQLDARALGCAMGVLRDTRRVVLAAVEKDGNALIYASKRLQNDEELLALVHPVTLKRLKDEKTISSEKFNAICQKRLADNSDQQYVQIYNELSEVRDMVTVNNERREQGQLFFPPEVINQISKSMLELYMKT